MWILTVCFEVKDKEEAHALFDAFDALEPAGLSSMVITEEKDDDG